tara:strand:+ start:109 stop:1392 length:1284 start_codon:yes stop_codon:yes gene_type:complete
VRFSVLWAAALLLPVTAQASQTGELLTSHLYAGTLQDGQAALAEGKDAEEPEACFGWGLLGLAGAFEGLAQDFYRYGATTPSTPAAALFLGIEMMDTGVPINPAPEPLSYQALRTVLEDFRSDIAAAQASFECGGADGADFVVPVDTFKARLDFNGDGQTDEAETLGAFLAPLFGSFGAAMGDEALDEKTRSKTGRAVPDATIGFDAADAIWFAGYSQIVKTHLDLVLAHDFEAFYNAYLHRVFPRAGLPMQEYAEGGMLMVDPETDATIADLVAAIHTLNFPVIDKPLLAGIPDQLKHATALSRRNWELIMAETDDNRELVPNPGQTSLFPDMPVTDETVAAWRETLDVVDQILDGKLLVPHWRFKQGLDLKAYFETAERSDLVMLMTGGGALPFLRDGPVADAESFAAANAVFGEAFFNYALWFN